jgi:transcriptional regulator with XRE-family HTH domain
MASALFKRLLEQVPKETEEEVERSITNALRIHKWMRKVGMSRAEFAQLIGESEDKISRWLTGMYTFTTEDLIKIEALFDKFSAPVSKKGSTLKITRNGNKLASKQSKPLQKPNIIESDNKITPPQKKKGGNGHGQFVPFSVSTQSSIVVEKYD